MVQLLSDDFYENDKIDLKIKIFENIHRSSCNVGSRSNVKKLFDDLSNGCQPI
jgi:hypothetical protein